MAQAAVATKWHAHRANVTCSADKCEPAQISVHRAGHCKARHAMPTETRFYAPMTKFHHVVGVVESPDAGLRRVDSVRNGRLSMRASMLSWFVLSAAGWAIVFGLLLFFGLIG